MGLTGKQRQFVEHYLQCFNAAEAARRAGYSARTANQQGARLLTNVGIAAEIKARFDQLAMSSDESMMRLTEQARALYADYIQADGSVDLDGMKRDSRMHLVKSVKVTQWGTNVEFHDAQAALFRVLQIRGLFVERVEATVTTNMQDVGERLRARIEAMAARMREDSDLAESNTADVLMMIRDRLG
jgi:phage terminase small subunit